MPEKDEGIPIVIRRNGAVLIFSMGIPIVEPRWVPEVRFPPASQGIPGGTDSIFNYVQHDHSANVP